MIRKSACVAAVVAALVAAFPSSAAAARHGNSWTQSVDKGFAIIAD